MCTSECSSKLRYRGIDVVYIRVKLLYKHDGTPQGSLKKRFPTPSLNDSEERSVGKVRQDNLAFLMNAMKIYIYIYIYRELKSNRLYTDTLGYVCNE